MSERVFFMTYIVPFKQLVDMPVSINDNYISTNEEIKLLSDVAGTTEDKSFSIKEYKYDR